MQKRFLKHGFTLIELMLVVGIIMVLASLVMVSVSKSRARGRDGKRIADLSSIQLALEMYKDSNNSYPSSMPVASWAGVNVLSADLSRYLSPIPKDPINKNNFGYQIIGSSPAPSTGYWMGALFDDKDNIPSGFELGIKCYQIWGGGATSGLSAVTGYVPGYCN